MVLRGVGRGAGDTVLHGRNPLSGGTNPNQRPLVRIYGNGSRTNIGSSRNMIDKVVPAGSRSFRVDSTAGLAVGDTVRIERPSTQAWIDAVGMNNPPDGDPPWTPGSMDLRYDRVITRIEGDRVFVDAPLANSFEAQFGGGTIREYTWSGAIENIGIENLAATPISLPPPMRITPGSSLLSVAVRTAIERSTFGYGIFPLLISAIRQWLPTLVRSGSRSTMRSARPRSVKSRGNADTPTI